MQEIKELMPRVYDVYRGAQVKHPCDAAPFVYCGTSLHDNKIKPLLLGDWSGGTHNVSQYGTCEWDEIKLLLHPLSSITDEHAVEVSRRYHTDNDLHTAMDGHRIIKRMLENNWTYQWHVWSLNSVIDYLRSKGYNLPYMGIDLVKEGIAQLITTK